MCADTVYLAVSALARDLPFCWAWPSLGFWKEWSLPGFWPLSHGQAAWGEWRGAGPVSSLGAAEATATLNSVLLLVSAAWGSF